MFRRLQSLYRRYREHHALSALRGIPLLGPSGQRVGYVDRIERVGATLSVAGWARADRVTLSWPGGRESRVPSLTRTDVASTLGEGTDVGFVIAVDGAGGPFTLTVERAGRSRAQTFDELHGRIGRRRRLKLVAQFTRDLGLATPSILAWLRTGDLRYRNAVRRRMGLDHLPAAALIDARLLKQGGGPQPDPGKVTIVLPVFNAFDVLAEVLGRVERHTRIPFHLIVIEDASTDDRVRPWLRDWAAARLDWVTLVENWRNLGFIGSVNHGLGLALSRGVPIVLLNSDVFVPDDWARRLLAPMLADPQGVASVTPMSNDAEILSVPKICEPFPLAPGDVDQIDAEAALLHPLIATVPTPTGIGFCMAMNPAFLTVEPQFDPVFGRGYGEEVDWSQKVRAHGGVHLATAALFVEHRGGESFGQAAKTALLRENGARISRRYPSYDAEVQSFIAMDPLLAVRLTLGARQLAIAKAGPVPIYLAHAMGGGAEDALQAQLAGDVGAVVVRVGGTHRFGIELHGPFGTSAGATDDSEVLHRVLQPLTARRVIYSCGVGDPDPVTLPGLLARLLDGGQTAELEVRCHDYFMISPAYTLLGRDGSYRGVPPLETADPAHQASRAGGEPVPHAEWRSRWSAIMSRAARVVVFSEASCAILSEAYPDASAVIEVTPHGLLADISKVAPKSDHVRTIGVLGNIGPQKGARIVCDLAADADVQVVLIGRMDPAYVLPDGAVEHGRYTRDEIASLAQRYGVDAWVIPSIWPETFCFAVHEALATGLPVLAFDLGGQGDAVRHAPNGILVPYDPDGDWSQAMRNALRAL